MHCNQKLYALTNIFNKMIDKIVNDSYIKLFYYI